MTEALSHYRLPGLPVVCSEYPGGLARDASTRAKLATLAGFEPGVIVNLTGTADGLRSYDPAAYRFPAGEWDQGVWTPQLWGRPIPDAGAPATVEAFAAIIEEISQQRGWVAVHCRAGIGRTGLVACGLLVRHGWSADEAFACVDALWRTTRMGQRPNARLLRAPETEVQRAMVRAYAERVGGGTTTPLASLAMRGGLSPYRIDARIARGYLGRGARAIEHLTQREGFDASTAGPVLESYTRGLCAVGEALLRDLTRRFNGVARSAAELASLSAIADLPLVMAPVGLALEGEAAFDYTREVFALIGQPDEAAVAAAALASLVSQTARGASLSDAVSGVGELLLRKATASAVAASLAQRLSDGFVLGSLVGRELTEEQIAVPPSGHPCTAQLHAAIICASAFPGDLRGAVDVASRVGRLAPSLVALTAQLAGAGTSEWSSPEPSGATPNTTALQLLADDLSFGGLSDRWWRRRWLYSFPETSIPG